MKHTKKIIQEIDFKKALETKFGTSKELELLFSMKFNNDAKEFINKILS